MISPDNLPPEDAPALPVPKRADRWQPLRSGVLNLYRYDYEEFHFEDGRLLLRGNNGSGKSRVLALQLPFLLDGEVSPARVEPDGDAAKRIEWNLLMGRYPDRTGYTWIEFGRREADGTPRFLTLGCGLRAVAGHSGLHSRWFFITSQRIGRDLFLQNAQRTPLGREKLETAMGSAGRVILKVEEYRRAVDEALFGLGPRFGPLLELLLRLRRPQLSGKLNEEELTGSLSDALPTLPSTIIDDVAESFSSLQTDRGKLREFVVAREAVAAFLGEYGVYVRTAVRRRANAVRSAHTAYEAAQRAVRDAESRFATADAQLTSLVRQHAELETQLAGAESTERTLRDSPEMKTAEEVRLAGETAASADKALTDATADEERAALAETRTRANQARSEEQASRIAAELDKKLHVTDAAAASADLATEHRRELPAERSASELLSLPADAEATLRRALTQRERAISVLRAHEKTVAAAQAAFDAAETARRRAENEAAAARDAEHSARDSLAGHAANLLSNFTVWRATVRQLRPPAADALADAFAAWSETRDGASPLRHAIDNGHRAALVQFAARDAALAGSARELDVRMAELDANIERLEKGETPPPAPPPLRGADRTGRPGAPFWRICDFRPAVSAEARAGLEAALQAAGILDAWVLPDGRLFSDTDDTFLLESSAVSAPASQRHVGEVLAITLDGEDPAMRELARSRLEHLLSQIGLGEGAGLHWVATDGRWQLGPLGGRARKSSADYIGESTRAEARRRQLAELRTQRSEVTAARERVDRDVAALESDRAKAAEELASAPTDEPVLRAGYALESATRAVAAAFNAAEFAVREAAARRSERDEATTARDRDAADLKLIAWLGRLDALAQATGAYANALAGLWPTASHWETMAAQMAALREQTAAAVAELQTRRERREQAANVVASARQRFETLQEMHGEAVAVVLRKLELSSADVQRLKGGLTANQRQQLADTATRTKAEGDRTAAEQQQVAHEATRRTAITSLQRLAEQRLLAEADPALRDIDPADWSVAQAIEIVRHRIDKLLTDVADDDQSWQRRQDAIHGHIQELRDQLIAHGHQPEPHQSEDIVLVRCVFQARPHTMTELRDAFAGEVAERERLLKAREQEIIENHLLAEAAVELQKLIQAAEEWRASANEELSARPTSSGVRFRFQWEPDTEIHFNEVRPVLLRRGELRTPAERTALAAFLQGRIAAEQNADESGSWRDHLSRALDYRRWHRFVVERQQDGQWRRLNRATYGTGSGGEKALALTLPRFAAAAAHYRSAAKTAPRLVMLDEAFAGIDPTMRAQCMGVLTQFDLDVVMTSELEWGCYRTVPSLAIYHLTTLPGIDAVAATRWIWNGREKRQEDLPLPRDAAAEPQANGSAPVELDEHHD